MITTLCRAVILFATVILAMRLMGKRQIGEMQPTELVVTILLSEVAAIPLQDTDVPLITSVAAVLLLVSLSIFTSILTLHNARCRELFEGHPAIVVRDGKPDFKKMKALRITVQDLLSALRQKDVFEDGRILQKAMADAGLTQSQLAAYLNKSRLRPDDVMLLTYGANGFGNLTEKEGNK